MLQEGYFEISVTERYLLITSRDLRSLAALIFEFAETNYVHSFQLKIRSSHFTLHNNTPSDCSTQGKKHTTTLLFIDLG